VTFEAKPSETVFCGNSEDLREVYLAQDTRLDRKVALKILPADVAVNNDRMRRFVRKQDLQASL
jgi:serine/threonine protein kinase